MENIHRESCRPQDGVGKTCYATGNVHVPAVNLKVDGLVDARALSKFVPARDPENPPPREFRAPKTHRRENSGPRKPASFRAFENLLGRSRAGEVSMLSSEFDESRIDLHKSELTKKQPAVGCGQCDSLETSRIMVEAGPDQENTLAALT